MAFVQTQFFGLSIVNFTSSMGWGDSPSTLGVTLVLDPSNGDALVNPIQGQPAIFAYGSFQFGGIVKSFGRNDDFGGSPIFNMSLEDPRELLSGVSMILSGYNGTISVPNVINVYGYLENVGGYGASESSSAGIPWYKVRNALEDLINGASPNYGGAIRLGSYEFRLNLDALPTLPDYYRLTSPNMSILDFVREVCDAANHDYFFTLTAGNYINLRTINRNVEPILGSVAAFILTTPGASAKNIGYEFRNEITSKFLIGGPVSRMYGVNDVDSDEDNEDVLNPQDNVLWPFWGLESETDVVDSVSVGGDVIMGMGYGDYHTFTVDSRLLKSELLRNNKVGMFDTYTMDVGELRAARYSQEAWEAYLWFHNYNEFRFYSDLYGDLNDDYYIRWIYSKRVDKFNENGDYVGFEEDYFYKLDENGQSVVDYDTKYKFNVNIARNELFDKRYSDDAYGISNPHWGKASRLGLVGGILLGSVAHFISSRSNEEIGRLTAQSITAMSKQDHEHGAESTQQEENIGRIYNFVKRYADEYYGKKWMVRVPAVSAYKDPETLEVRFSHTPESTGFIDESEWEDAIQNNLLPFDVNRITDTDGRFFAFVKFPKYNDLDVTDLFVGTTPEEGEDYTYSVNGRYFKRRFYLFNDISEEDKIDSEVHNSIFIKCEIDPQIYFEDAETQYKPRVVITMPGIVKLNIDDTNDIGILSTFLTDQLSDRDGLDVESNVNRIVNSFGSDMFRLGKEGFAYRPQFTAIPLRSNVLVYGPWYASGENGRTEFEQDDTLVPWNYGGFPAMNNAAEAKVTSAISLYNISEAGSVEFPDLPGISLGDPLTNGGPYVTEVTVSIDGNSGARTNYNLATWTPHPYRMRKFLSDYISRLSKTNQQLRRNFREQLRQPKQRSRLAELKTKTIDGLRRRPRSTHFLIGGEVKADSTGKTRYMVGLQPVYNATSQLYGNEYANKALTSLDSLFVPFSTNPNASGMARFERPTESGQLNIDDYNPFRSGTTTSIITHGQTFPESISTEQGDIDFTDVRAIGLKTPLILAGWGYDIDEKPVPNSGMIPYSPSSGVIAYSGTPGDYFHQDYLQRQDLWKVGPLDTKWDDDRKVWVAGSPNRTKIVQILDRLPQSGLSVNRQTTVIAGGTPEFFVASGDPDSTTKSGVYPIELMTGRYRTFGSGYYGGLVYYAREWEIDYPDIVGNRTRLTHTNDYLYVASFRPNMIEPSGFWTAYELNGKMILDSQMQFWDHSIFEV
jgi:hypothetical protein